MMRNAKPAFAWLPFPVPFRHVLASALSAVSFAKKMVRSESLPNRPQVDDGGPCVPISWRAATEAVSAGRYSKLCYSTSAEQTDFEHPPVTSRITFV